MKMSLVIFLYFATKQTQEGSLGGEERLTYEPQHLEHYWNKLKLTFHSLPEDGVSGLATIKLMLFFEKDMPKTCTA